MNEIIACVIIVISIIAIIFVLYQFFKSPFKYPYYIISVDISGKRNVQIENVIDSFLNDGGYIELCSHNELIQNWKSDCKRKIEKSIFKKLRKKQYIRCLDDNNAYLFKLCRTRTRYKQTNYIKTSYQVSETIDSFSCSFEWLEERNNSLSKINHQATLNEYFSSNQRKLMTKELKEQIAKRDNYTCQMCGKYMPDGVGLHIDHIYPISKGGKSIPSNLQVLCSKCNGKKSNKTR
ncbi:MAG: HNH endonuclease [Ruminococcus sp.]|nr:HNH endonuclease [Ruminococcus sp.]